MAKACINLPEWKNLPQDCWELIFNRLPNYTYFEPLSLVCKDFLFITNRLRFRLSAADSEILMDGNISKLVNRFPNLKSIDFSDLDRNTDVALLGKAISCLLNVEEIDISNKSEIPIWGLSNTRSLRVLKCKNLDVLRDTDLVAIANSLPFLEELDIREPKNCYCRCPEDLGSRKMRPVTDAGIKGLAMNVKRLRRINVSRHDFITAESLVCLSMNCRYLEGIEVKECRFMKPYGILFLLRNSATLRSISICLIDFRDTRSSLVFEEDSVSYGRCLESLEISYSHVPDEFLYRLARANNNLALKRLSLVQCLSEITFSALSSLLCRCQSLRFLEFGPSSSLTDESIRDLSPYLRNLVAVKLEYCYNLTISTFYILAKSCPLLQDIEMVEADIGEETCSINMDCMNKYMNIKSLNLAFNRSLNDECLKRFAFICPNLEKIDVSYCKRITEEGIVDVLDMCPQLRSFKFGDY